jgi:ribose transport system ATP-binding protein
MEEVLKLSDRITVMRDGGYVGDLLRAEATHDKIVQMMVGRELSGEYFPTRTSTALNEAVLEVENLLVPGTPEGVSFNALKGEILGFAGLVGAGRTELMQTIFGVTPAFGGTMKLLGTPFVPQNPRDAIARGVLLAPEDRKRHGLVLPMTIAQNTSLPNISSYARFGWLDRATEKRVAEAEVKRLRTKTFGITQKVVNLSGGNQQKVVLGKWLAMNPKILILDEPTRGIDVGAKAEIYRHMAGLAAEGITILMVSSDMEEILGMSDRVVVMHEKRLRGVLPREGLTQERIAKLMTGGGAQV